MTDGQQPPIEPYEPRAGHGSIDPAVRKIAVERIEARRTFGRHLRTYVIMSAMFVAVWFFSGEDYFWPVWPMLGWGLGLAFHALSLRDGQITQEQIAAEAAKISPPPSEGPQDRV